MPQDASPEASNALAVEGVRPEVIERRIRAFESFGIHRTGWEGDDRTSTWLRDELAALGIDATVERFDFPRVETRTARFRWDRESVDGVPLHDAGFTRYGGIDGDLTGEDDSDLFGKIVIARATDGGPSENLYAWLEAIEERGAFGVVLISGDRDGDVVVRNAERIARPLEIPVLQVSTREAGHLSSAVLVGGEGVLEIDGERLRSRATNVVATLPGSDPEAAPLGLMTPKSGWFTCAAERGGGIAAWLAAAEALAAMPDRLRTVHLLASSGHELHHRGLTSYLAERPGLAAGAIAWLHLGASIGAREARARMAASDDALTALATRALTAEGIAVGGEPGAVEPLPTGSPGGGEARDIHAQGGRYVSFLGGHPYFHSPNDTFDRAVDLDRTAAYARATVALARALHDLED